MPHEPSDYPRIEVTVDVVALAQVEAQLHVLLVRRGREPFEGRWALPGGFLEVDEDAAPAAARELHEETGIALHPHELRQVAAYADPHRDPRGRVVSIAHLAELEQQVDPEAGDDASHAEWVPLAKALAHEGELAFDHAGILRDAVAVSRWAALVTDVERTG